MTLKRPKFTKPELDEIKSKAVEIGRALRPRNMKRITDEPFSYFVYKLGKTVFIGRRLGDLSSEILPNFYPNRTEYDLTNSDGKTIAKVQKL